MLLDARAVTVSRLSAAPSRYIMRPGLGVEILFSRPVMHGAHPIPSHHSVRHPTPRLAAACHFQRRPSQRRSLFRDDAARPPAAARRAGSLVFAGRIRFDDLFPGVIAHAALLWMAGRSLGA